MGKRARIPGGSATLIVIGALAVAAALSPAAAVAAFPGGNGLIAFSGSHSGRPDLDDAGVFTIRPDGSGLRRLTDGGATRPSWSADGQRIVYEEVVHREAPTPDDPPFNEVTLFTIDADGGERTRIVDFVSSTHEFPTPTFSPTGRRIAYAAGGWIRTIRADGTQRRRLLSGFVDEPQYSPNGRRIVFAGRPEGKKRSGIWDMRRDGSRLRRLTNPSKSNSDLSDLAPEYSPDGRHIIFARSEFRCCVVEIRMMRADGSREHTIPGARYITDLGHLYAPAFAPAGDRIALPQVTGSGKYPPFCSDLYTISSTGSDPRRVTNRCDETYALGGTASYPTWQPDPPSTFTFAGVKKNKRRGTARLRVRVPGPGALRLEKTKRVKPKRKRAASAGRVTLRVRPRGTARKRIRRCRSAKVRARVAYKPDGAGRNARLKRIKLKRPARRLRDRTASAAWSRGVRTVCRRLPS